MKLYKFFINNQANQYNIDIGKLYLYKKENGESWFYYIKFFH